MADNPQITSEQARRYVASMPEVCREIRRMLNLTLEQLAAELGTTIVRLHYYETGKRLPRPTMAVKYVTYLVEHAAEAGINLEEVQLRVLLRRPNPQQVATMIAAAQHDGAGPVAELRAARAHVHVKEQP